MKTKVLFIIVLLCAVVQGAWATTPNGSFDSCTAIDGGIRVYGWTYDPDAPAESLNIHIYLYDVNNTLLSITSMGNTGRMRADVNQTFGISGTHGFDYYIPITTAGTYFVELYAIDATDPINENKLIGERKTVAVTTPWSAKETVSSEVDLMLATAAGGSFKLGADIQLTSYLYVSPGKTVTLDLNGKTLSRSLAAADNLGSVIRVDNGGTLTVKDSSGNNSGKITGGRATNGGGITNHGTLTFEGGTITDCSASNWGGGIFNAPITVGNTPATMTMTGGVIDGCWATDCGGIFNYAGCTLTISGGEIKNCVSDLGGGAVVNNGTLTISGGTFTGNRCQTGGGGVWNSSGATMAITGGTITGCSASYGGGIYNNGVLNMSGNPVITGNAGPNNCKENLNLAENAVITVTGAFTTGAKVGITNFSLSRVLTSGYSTYNSRTAPTSIFSSDVANYTITLNDDSEVLVQGNWGAEQEVEYIRCSWDGTKVVKEKVTATAKRLNDINAGGSWVELSGTYYVVGPHDTNGMIIVTPGNELNIILCDGATLVSKSINTIINGTLRIFAQEHETGKITISQPEKNYPAIGQSYYPNNLDVRGSGGIIEIHGGDISATGGINVAGIGAGICHVQDGKKYTRYAQDFARLDIYGGTIQATGGESDEYEGCGAGIGGTHKTEQGVINIYGGNITAFGGEIKNPYKSGGAGIGGGYETHLDQVNIFGGKVYAYAGKEGAGIGGGYQCDGGIINISGGYVEAYGYKNSSSDMHYCGAGIGGGYLASGGNITISGGTVIAKGGYDAAGIGSGQEPGAATQNIDGGNITISGGNVTAYGNNGGCGIGGGYGAAMGNILITGGTIHAIAGSENNGKNAIGGNDTSDGANSLTIGNNMEAWDAERSALNNDRAGFCAYRGDMWLATCDHNGTWGPATFTDKGNGTHDVANCQYCFTTNEAHIFDDNLQCTRCDYHATNIASLSGSGTQVDPYLITSPDDWNTLSDYSKAASTEGVYFRQTANITITKTLGILDAQYAFGGVYDGDGYTIDVSGITGEVGGPFPHIQNATIRGLHIVGTMTGSVCAGGLVGVSDGTCLVEDCRVSSTITGNASTYGPHLGGIVGHGNTSALTVRGCLFDGELKASSSYTGTDRYAGAIVGWCNDATNIQTIDCLEQGTYTDFTNVNLNFFAGGSTTAVKKTNCYSLSHSWDNVPGATSVAEQTGNTALCTYPTTSITFYKNYVTVGNSWYAIGDYAVTDNLSLADNTDNSTTLDKNNGHCANVTLKNRTLYKDGKWNTICLPFDLVLEGSALNGATARTLTAASISGTTLNLTFGDAVSTLAAGTPYIIKWASGDNIVSPVFEGVTIKSDMNDVVYNLGDSKTVNFKGTYACQSFDDANKSILYLGDGNKLYYPNAAMNINAFRAYFQLYGIEAGDLPATSVRLFFGGSDEDTGISTTDYTNYANSDNAWYTLDGRKIVNSQSSNRKLPKGVYIHSGKKRMIK